MRAIGLDRKSRDYLGTLNIDPYSIEERFIHLESVIKANISFKTKLENFKQFIDCLSGDRCFVLWTRETEDLLIQSEEALRQYAYNGILETDFKEIHHELASRIKELVGRIYEGHWAYGGSREADQQFDELTELCRRIWDKESKAWITLAKAWDKIDFHLIVYNDEPA